MTLLDFLDKHFEGLAYTSIVLLSIIGLTISYSLDKWLRVKAIKGIVQIQECKEKKVEAE